MAYETWLNRKEWQKRRNEILARDNYNCQCASCTTPNSILEVHHKEYLSYDRKPWEYPDDMLITLCKVCHAKENTRSKSEESLFTCLKMKGFLVGDIICLEILLYSDDKFTKELLQRLKNMQRG